VVAPSLVPERPGERVETNRRDAPTLARPRRAGELTPVRVPDPGHEAMREPARAREAAMEDLRAKRRHLRSFPLRRGRVFAGRGAWTRAHTRWPCEPRFERPAQRLVPAGYRRAILDAEARLERLTRRVADSVPSWSTAPVIAAHRALRGVAFPSAVAFAAEIGGVRRFDGPRPLMAHLGLAPSGSSTGERARRGGITQAGDGRARRVLIEGAWTRRFPARMGRPPRERQAGLPKAVCDIARRARPRLRGRHRKLMARGERRAVVTTAIAREMAAFLWAIGREVEPRSAA
jgi:transposase